MLNQDHEDQIIFPNTLLVQKIPCLHAFLVSNQFEAQYHRSMRD